MSREIDIRNFSINKIEPERQAEMASRALRASELLPGSHQVRVAQLDSLTGNPSMIVSEQAPAQRGNYIQRALDHMARIKGALGFTASQASEFAADPHVQETSSGSMVVHLQQQYHGIPIFQAAQSVCFGPDGALSETVGNSISVEQAQSTVPTLAVEDAVMRAAQHVAIPDEDEIDARDQFGEPLSMPQMDLAGFTPKVVAAFTNQADSACVLDKGPFDEALKARLVWFPVDEELRLGWEVLIMMPEATGQYRTIVDARNGEILYCHQLINFVAARGNVYHVDGSTQRRMTDFPRALEDYNLPAPVTALPANFPESWVGNDSTTGNSAHAHLGESGPVYRGNLNDGVVVFNPSDPTGDDQKVLNIFYFNCFMHDYFYQLGFREADGNFQANNFGRGGAGADAVDARAHSGTVQGTANMLTRSDGRSPIMNMGLVTNTNRHTAFDSSVVFHEFTHGVTNRLVGGPLNASALEQPQSGGMGEGWSDYIACTINNSTVVGSWVVGRAGGIRQFRYDANFPDNFGMVGSGRYSEEHNLGEIWCAGLLDINRNIGANLAVQLVVDSLKLAPANPGFLDARDAMLRALDNKRAAGQLTQDEYANARRGMWTAFAKFGMGIGARSNGASLSGIVGNSQLPSDLGPTGSGSGTGTGPGTGMGGGAGTGTGSGGSTGGRNDVHVEARPNLAIPDNQASGLRNVLSVRNMGAVRRLTVSVDIEHSYIGDLRVTLFTPSGRSVMLHNRNGGNTRNLIRTYASEQIAELGALAGEAAQGNWALVVADLAPQDVGRLRSWSLDLGVDSAGTPNMPNTLTARGEARPGLRIPDNDSVGIGSTIAIAQAGALQSISVALDITHTYIGDLRVELVSPSGRQVLLHNRSGSGQDNLIQTYDSTNATVLQSFAGERIQGNWVLRIVDRGAQDVGKLNRWALQIIYTS